MSFFEFLFLALGLLALTFAGLFIARIRRENRDAALSEASGGWKIRSQLPITLGDPYNRFAALSIEQPYDVMEGTEEGFDVSYFEVAQRRGRQFTPRPCALIQLPVEGPTFSASEDSPAPAGLGPETTDALSLLPEMRVQTAPFALLVQSRGASQTMVHRTALRVAKAIVADASRPAR